MALAELHVLSGHTQRVWSLCWHPTLPLLASCGEDRSLRLWAPSAATPPPAGGGAAPLLASSARAWRCILDVDDISPRTVRCCAWSPCGRFLAAACFDHITTVWRVGGGALAAGGARRVAAAGGVLSAGDVELEPLARLDGHEHEVKCVAFSASGELVATCSRDKSIWVWRAVDEGSDFETVGVLMGHEADVKAVAWHPHEDLLASASYDDSLRLWGEAEEDWVGVQVVEHAHASTAWALDWDAAGARVASVGEDRALRVWDAGPAPLGATPVPRARHLRAAGTVEAAHGRTALSVSWARHAGGEDLIATGGADDAVRVYRAGARGAAPALAAEAPRAHGGDVNCVRWHPNEPLLATAGDDGAVRLWSYADGGGAAEGAGNGAAGAGGGGPEGGGC
jgi:WD40 repeat protein